MKDITVVIPAYNEEEIIAKTLSRILFWKKKNNYKFEIILVNDGSTDNTENKIKKFYKKKLKLVNQRHAGQFSAIINGVKRSRSDLVVIMESDLSVDCEIIKKLYKYKIHSKYDVVTVSRNLKKSVNLNKPLFRKFISLVNFLIFKFLFKTNITDPQVSVKIYKKKDFLKYANRLISINDGMRSTEIMLNYLHDNKTILETPSKYIYRYSNRNISKKKFINVCVSCTVSLFKMWVYFRAKEKKDFLKKKITRF